MGDLHDKSKRRATKAIVGAVEGSDPVGDMEKAGIDFPGIGFRRRQHTVALEIGEKLKTAREAAGYSRDELDRLVGIPENTCLRFEVGGVIFDNAPKAVFEQVSQIAQFLGVSVADELIRITQLSQKIKRVENLSKENGPAK